MHRLTSWLTAAAILLAGCSGTPTGAESTSSDPAATGSATPSSGPSAGASAATPQAHRGPDEMPALHPSVDDYPEGRAVLELADGDTWDIPVLIAANNAHRAHGLMEVPDVPAATGMAFVFAEDGSGGFWMKGTATDLDIAWFRADGTVVATTTMTVCPGDPCPSYPPGTSYRYALEVRAGWFAEIGLTVGDRIGVTDAAGNPPTAS